MIDSLERWTSEAVATVSQRGLARSVGVKVTPPRHPGSGYVFDFDGDRIIGQFVVWQSGAVEASAVEIATEERIYFKSVMATETKEVEDVFDDLVRVLTQQEAG